MINFPPSIKCVIIFWFLVMSSHVLRAQVLFTEECFTGGVTVGGYPLFGSVGGKFQMKWEEGYTLRRAFVVTYRYGRPAPHTMYVNGRAVHWDYSSQPGPELPEINPLTDFFAAHVVEITEGLEITGPEFTVNSMPQPGYPDWNWGWHSAYVVVLYEAPDVTQEVCLRLYTADQSQNYPQMYCVPTPNFREDTPLVFSIHGDRITEAYDPDATRISVNEHILGDIWGPDYVVPRSIVGVQGHFYYENGTAEGLNGDTVNDYVHYQDGVAAVNAYLSGTGQDCYRFEYASYLFPIGANPHPAFVLAYTPSCEVVASEIPRRYTVCRGDALELEAVGYDNYAWTPGDAMNDSTLAHPVLVPDSSGWYRVSMWDEDGTACPQTIPVFVEVEDIPRPQNLEVVYSLCTDNTGRIEVSSVPGKAPWAFYLNGQYRDNGNLAGLSPGEYTLSITTALGCSWDTTLTVPVKHLQTAAFTVDPLTGYSPLEVRFRNESTGAANYRWLIDGEPVSTNTHLQYMFSDSGVYEITLMAFVGSPEAGCPDTARFTLVVLQGLKMILPNIITPNGDGKNDALVAKLSGVATLRWEVFNRWGQALHGGEASEPPASFTLWTPDNDFPDGVYTLALTAIGHSGQVTEKVVQVVLKR